MQALLPVACLAILAVPISLAAQEPVSPYADDRSAEVKTLSTEEARGLLSGEGMGLARPAEMNNYPGPRHVLELADSLDLEPEQTRAVESIRGKMQRRAIELGEAIVAKERSLDRAFASGTPREAGIRQLLHEIGELEARLRFTHLQAHLSTTDVLTRHQVHEYARLRGYAAHEAHEHGRREHRP